MIGTIGDKVKSKSIPFMEKFYAVILIYYNRVSIRDQSSTVRVRREIGYVGIEKPAISQFM